MNNASVDLKQAIIDQDLYTIQCFMVDEQNSILKNWLDEPSQVFCSSLQRSLQKLSRVKRQFITPGDEIPYQLGFWEGWLQAFRSLYDEENKKKDILELAVAKSPNTAKIIRFLYQYGKPICHGNLADALGMNYSALTNAMKRAIGCGAVSASRTGRNTRYTLTPAAKQYCQEETKWKKIIPKSEVAILIEKLEKLTKILQAQNKPIGPSISASAGDLVRIMQSDGHEISKQMRLKQIVKMCGEKCLELEPTDNNDPFLALPFSEDVSPEQDYIVVAEPLTASCGG